MSVLVHEVRSPVAALAAVGEAIRDTTGSPGRAELVGLAIGACAAIERIVSDIAVASIRPVPIDVGRIVVEVVASRRLVGVEIAAEIDDDLPLVEADPIRLRQALDNLVTNAVVHAGLESPVGVRATRSSVDSVTLSVVDSGAGMAPEALERIFEPGVRLDERTPGMGLGLAVTKALVVAHGGTLSVESELGRGTTFTIAIPVRPQSAT